MKNNNPSKLKVVGASENNLKNIDVQIPHNSLTVITGVSGSGKSSLAYNVVYKESQRRFLESFSSYSRQYIGKLEKPDVKLVTGLQASLAINQKATVANPRSTVGTMSGIYDYLRLLYARIGVQVCSSCGLELPDQQTICNNCNTENPRLLSKLFSFNSNYGACPNCKGLGVSEQIDIDKLIADENLTLREGALVPTTPTGYIVYSQVRVDELNKVCEAHGFSVDIPWKDLSKEQQDVIMFGSERVKILFGKHSLESRLKWKGITALPREESYYKGMIPIMEEILRRDRNDNILRFASSFVCDECNGTRLKKEARSVTVDDKNICQLVDISLSDLYDDLTVLSSNISDKEVVDTILNNVIKRLEYIQLLGLNYLTLSRESTTLSGGESQRIKLASQVGSGLQGILYILDEPSIGLHPRDNCKLLKVLTSLRNNGNTLLVVEHDEQTINAADYLIDIGPKAGIHGGELMYQGNTNSLLNNLDSFPNSLTAKLYFSDNDNNISRSIRKSNNSILIYGAKKNNLKNIDVEFKLDSFNVVTGVSGAGKSSLVHDLLGINLKKQGKPVYCNSIQTTIPIGRVIEIDQSPIGRTPRSNPATYTDLFDHIRTLFSKQPESLKRGYKKGRFSFNNKGGRCEHCQGAGYIELGMHFLGNVEIVCENCNGKRFNNETLEVKFKGKNIFNILELPIEEARTFFDGNPKITRILDQLLVLDLGYLKLGQSSTTLSGGEAQRVKLASELYKASKGHNLYILDEPSVGLHKADVRFLLSALNEIVDNGNTVIVIEHDIDVIKQADFIIDLGPEGGEYGGDVIFQGTPEEIIHCKASLTGQAMFELQSNTDIISAEAKITNSNISFKGVSTNNLKNIDIEIPLNETTVITGVSGSGKTSLAFDTIYSESRNRFTESLSSYARRMMSKVKKPELEQCTGLTPSVAIRQNRFRKNPRSTVGTATEIYDLYRLLFSRFGIDNNGVPTNLSASMFSFNKAEAACEQCKGLGIIITSDSEKFITNPDLSLVDGAMDGTNPGKFFGDINGQYVVTLLEVGRHKNIDFTLPYSELDAHAKEIALYGTGDEEYNVSWKFKRGSRTGTHELTTSWKGFIYYLNEDYEIKRNGKRGEAFKPIMTELDCPHCKGSRYKSKITDVVFAGVNIVQLSKLSITNSLEFFHSIESKVGISKYKAIESTKEQIIGKLVPLIDIGIGYLSVNRPTSTLSGGEAQRLRIASQLVSDLCGLTYVLDEPTIGLHSHDTENLLVAINKIKNNGNTVIMVEHDPDVIIQADNIIDIGPGAGVHGGEIIAQGKISEIIKNPLSITGRYLVGNSVTKPSSRIIGKNAVKVNAAKANNLKKIDVVIPVNCITTISGVSGSGKSSLVFDVIADSYNTGLPINCSSIEFNDISSLSIMNQDKIGTSPLSTSATYTGMFDIIRGEFAKLPEAKSHGFNKSHFSFNSKEGKCPVCKGMGSTKVSMDFLSDVWVVCDNCHGNRYNNSILKIKLNDKSIIDVLNMEITEALDFFSLHTDITKSLQILNDVGLGYIKLGQATNTLSGGETQRLKLATELIKNKSEKCLFIFDEPSTGLHMKDVENLISVFNSLVDDGNTVLVVEHNLEIIRSSDWVIDLGTEGGELGGNIVYKGDVDGLKKSSLSYTGKALINQYSDDKHCK